MKNKKLLFVGAIGGMSYSVKLAESLGYEVICTDYYKDSQAKDYASQRYNVSTTDVKELSKIIEDNGICGVFSGFSDVNIRTTEELCRKYSMPCYIDDEQLRILQDKNAFKEACRKYSIRTPRKYDVNDKTISFPVIVKPSDSYASKGISVCHSASDLDQAYKKAVGVSRNGEAIIEEYIRGEEVMVHFAMLNGRLKITSVLCRKLASSFEDNSRSLSPVVIYNSKRYKDDVMANEEKLQRLFSDLGFSNVVGFIQGMAKKDEVYFFEPAVRFGGNVSELFNIYCNNVNIIEKFIDYSASGIMDDSDMEGIDPDFDCFCANITLFLNEGKVSKVIGEDKMYHHDSIKDYQRYYHIGQLIRKEDRYTYGGTAYRIICIGRNKDLIVNDLGKMRKELRIVDDNDKDLLDWDTTFASLMNIQEKIS